VSYCLLACGEGRVVRVQQKAARPGALLQMLIVCMEKKRSSGRERQDMVGK
jgi:hypothetical protein